MATVKRPKLVIRKEASDLCAVILEGTSKKYPEGRREVCSVEERHYAEHFANSFNSMASQVPGSTRARVVPVTWKLTEGGAA